MLNQKAGFVFRVPRPEFAPGTREVLDFWAVAALFAFLIWCILVVPVPGHKGLGQDYKQDSAAAARADIPEWRWVYDSTGTYLIPESIAPTPVPAEQPRP